MGEAAAPSELKNPFKKACYTAIISDLHLCEAEPVHPKYPLWKKYKTAQFFFDDTFADFLEHLQTQSAGEKIELVLNGDIFDFDSMTALPQKPLFRIFPTEKRTGLLPREQRSSYKIQRILQDHNPWVQALRQFLLRGHNCVITIGNHDLELHYPEVQKRIREALNLDDEAQERLRFVEWFYISNQDTLIEHGNQYDPYCVCEDPLNPYIKGYNYRTMKLPFGNLDCRYLTNSMGFFNPHVDSNYIMSPTEYIAFFFKYMARAQPLVILTWLWASTMTLVHSLRDHFARSARNPFRTEDRVNEVARRSNATPRTVRELSELFVMPATTNPILVARELWLDRAFLVFVVFTLLFLVFLFVRQVYAISIFWLFIPLFLFLPFFLFYSKSIISNVQDFKEPQERILFSTSLIAKVNRVVYGHTHMACHEWIGAVEHLNSGCWSPAFTDVQCTKPVSEKNYVWIAPSAEDPHKREAGLYSFEQGRSRLITRS